MNICWPLRLALIAVLLGASCMHAQCRTETPATTLDAGFHRLYDLDFAGAQDQFAAWQKQQADNPLGPVSEAAGVLFQELNRLGVLEAQFFVSDSGFKARPAPAPDPEARRRFDSALARAENLARRRLEPDSTSEEALLALTLVSGLRADYAALIEKRNLASLQYTRAARFSAEKLLASHPECYDAYVATGISDYVLGSLSAPVRVLLRLGGYSGDKQRGLTQLQQTAAHGRYLAPFARLLLAIAYLRDQDKPRARQLLAGLHQQFPHNDLVARELARLEAQP